MKIELKNLKHSASLSQETNAYTGIIYIDGKKAIEASNHGTGGADRYRPIAPFTYKDIEAVEAFCKASRLPEQGDGYVLEHSLEIEIGDQITEQLARKVVNRMVKSKIVVLDENNGDPFLSTYPAKFKPTPENFVKVTGILKKGQYLVNGNADLETRALKLV